MIIALGEFSREQTPQAGPLFAQRPLGQRRETERTSSRHPQPDRRLSADEAAVERGARPRVAFQILPEQPEEGAHEVPEVRELDAERRGEAGALHAEDMGAHGRGGRAGATESEFHASRRQEIRDLQAATGPRRGFDAVSVAARPGLEIREFR